ncbi:hypothetical protein P7K49_008649 [Saguinus oedipus]|uniref:Uncharacterized protein n=1 Tax=Saguinus oedipus TaxID=9490 RepID=A0ABQ9W0P0_SAGOE|nr:hypothetical protein P7K49_008649 [Saguinus oedipus]
MQLAAFKRIGVSRMEKLALEQERKDTVPSEYKSGEDGVNIGMGMEEVICSFSGHSEMFFHPQLRISNPEAKKLLPYFPNTPEDILCLFTALGELSLHRLTPDLEKQPNENGVSVQNENFEEIINLPIGSKPSRLDVIDSESPEIPLNPILAFDDEGTLGPLPQVDGVQTQQTAGKLASSSLL